MSGTEHDPINFREVDSEGRPAGYGRTPDPAGTGLRSGAHAGAGPGAAHFSGAGFGVAPSGEADTGQPARLMVNPFIVALWVVVSGLIVSSFGVFTIAQETLNEGVPGPGMPLGYIWISFAPYVMFAGLLGLIGLLFWHAAQWRRNREKQAPPS
ncbi:hypothetical protein [Arthrobacter sp. ZGTC131]|uniref:hypothetical protein n=1 Tax=Arthrobacter sp. ZGTC131 TaxID=2058898 RepID=UPI000CE4B78D|nr:hypothetical protein [Arthrobacter sp. ZGTC131]